MYTKCRQDATLIKWLIIWRLKVDESQKHELRIKNAVAEEHCELSNNAIFCANAKIVMLRNL